MVDASARGTVLFSTGPTQGPRDDPQLAIAALREQLMGAVAVQLNVELTIGRSGLFEKRRPPTLSAYRAFTEGSAAVRRYEWLEGEMQFSRAIALDSTFTAAYSVLATGPLYNLHRYAAIDSVAQLMGLRLGSMTRLERAQMKYLKALVAGDGTAIMEAQRESFEIAPGGIVAFRAGMYALLLNRPREAVDFFWQFDDQDGWGAWPPQWFFMTSARHLLGEHRQELKEARRARERFPDNTFILFMEARALAALGQLGQLERVLDEMKRLGVVRRGLLRIAEELNAHGHRQAGSQLEQRILDSFEADLERPPLASPDSVTWARVLVRASRFTEARAVVDALVAAYPHNIGLHGYLGVVAAYSGDTGNAHAISRELAAYEGKYLLGNHHAWCARIAAVLGERDSAVDLLTVAFAEGVRVHPSDWRDGFGASWGEWEQVWPHSEPEFESLRGYPPFEELMRPKG